MKIICIERFTTLPISKGRATKQSEIKSHISYCVTAKSHIMHMGTHEFPPSLPYSNTYSTFAHTCRVYALTCVCACISHQARFHGMRVEVASRVEVAPRLSMWTTGTKFYDLYTNKKHCIYVRSAWNRAGWPSLSKGNNLLTESLAEGATGMKAKNRDRNFIKKVEKSHLFWKSIVDLYKKKDISCSCCCLVIWSNL